MDEKHRFVSNVLYFDVIVENIVATFRGMHVWPAKHSYAWLPRSVTTGQTHGQTGGRTDRRTNRQTPDKVIPMCRYASQATQQTVVEDT